MIIWMILGIIFIILAGVALLAGGLAAIVCKIIKGCINIFKK